MLCQQLVYWLHKILLVFACKLTLGAAAGARTAAEAAGKDEAGGGTVSVCICCGLPSVDMTLQQKGALTEVLSSLVQWAAVSPASTAQAGENQLQVFLCKTPQLAI